MNTFRLFNTLGREKQVFIPIEKDKVRFYHCGPTVYWTQHIGNMRGMTLADLVYRSLEYVGYDVTLVRNYTDVGHLTGDSDEGEDKMEKASKRESLSPQQIASKYIEVFEKDSELLNLTPPAHKPRATEYVGKMIEAVEILLEKGFAYSTPAAIYFDVSKAKDYTKLSGQNLENMIADAGKGVVSDPNKKSPLDFSVWFFKTGPHKKAIQYWESPFESSEVANGEGFPGWHIECVVMSTALLGDTLDIHMGGVEHIPVHHTNEIAQAEGMTGKKYVNYWLHNEHLLVDGGKMSKSEGTSYALSDIVKRGYDPLDLRYFFLTAHYRSKQNFTWDALEGARIARKKLTDRMKALSRVETGEVDTEWKEKFLLKLTDDVNVPGALAVVWDMLKSDLQDVDLKATILDFDKVLGLGLGQIKGSAISSEQRREIESLIKMRTEARLDKNYELADELRSKLDALGVVLEDTKDGVSWKLR